MIVIMIIVVVMVFMMKMVLTDDAGDCDHEDDGITVMARTMIKVTLTAIMLVRC